MRGEGARGRGGILGSIVGSGGGNGGWIAAMRVGVLGGGGGGGAGGSSGGGAGGCGGDVLAPATPCSGLHLSSSAPCANWHFLLYGHFPRLAKFWQTCVLYRTGSLMYAPGLRLIVCRAAAASGPLGVLTIDIVWGVRLAPVRVLSEVAAFWSDEIAVGKGKRGKRRFWAGNRQIGAGKLMHGLGLREEREEREKRERERERSCTCALGVV